MHYLVQAQFRTDTAADFMRKLCDRTIATQEPDGREIVASMNRAVVSDDGRIEWSETCYCDTPLAHERATVYDHHFDDLTTTDVDGPPPLPGKPFMAYLAELSDAQDASF